MKIIAKYLNNNWCVFGGLLIIALTLYANVINGPFLWDDGGLVEQNEYIRSFKYLPNWFTGDGTEDFMGIKNKLYRPISTMAYASVYGLFGLRETAYHLFLVLLHTANAFLVFLLLQKLKFDKTQSLLTTLLFLMHPVQTTAVSYIAGVPDVLSASFVLLGLHFFTNKKVTSLIITVVFFLLALLTKESGIMLFGLAALIAVYDWKYYKTPERRSKIIFFTALCVLITIYFWLRINYLNSNELTLNTTGSPYTESIWLRIITFISVIWDYAKLIFAPVVLYFDRLVYNYETLFSLRGAFGLIVVIGGLIFSYFSFKKGKKLFLGFLWFFIALGPVSGLIPVNKIYRENWLYIPLVGIGILIAVFWKRMKSKRGKTVFLILFTIAMLAFGARAVYRNFEWADPHAFFENELTYNKQFPRIYNEYGKLFYKEEDYAKAAEIFTEGILISNPKDQILLKLHYNLANAYIAQKDYNNAIVHFLMVFETNTNYLKAHEKLAELFKFGHRPDRAAKFAEFAERIKNGGTVTFEEILATKELK